MQEVSVIIPCYNAARYIGNAIDSILIQNVSCEIIIVDDNSVDNTKEVIKEYLKLDNFYYYHFGKKAGVAAARNFGVSKASGKFIAFLDADDIWVEGKLKKQLCVIEKEKVVICYTGRQNITDSGKIIGKAIKVKESVNYLELSLHNEIPCSSVLIRKEVAKEFPMEHDEYHEDYLTWLKCVKKYGRAIGIDEPLIYYRKSVSGKSRNPWKSIKMVYGVHRCMKRGYIKSSFFTLSHIICGLTRYI
jgi:teichuronic acid biosynthesis glycosyltransferase TuaG